MIHLSVIILLINDRSFLLFLYQIQHPDLYFTKWHTLSPYLPLCGVSTLQGPFGIFRLIGLFVYGINRPTLQEPFGIPRLKGLCGYGIRRVVTNVDERDIFPRIIINELD